MDVLAKRELTSCSEGKRLVVMDCVLWAGNYKATPGWHWQTQVKESEAHLLPKIRFKILHHLKQISQCISFKAWQILLH